MSEDKQIEEMAKSKKCNTCVHNAVCQELEEFRDPLGWISTEDEFVCSYYDAGYRKSTDLAREIFEEIRKIFKQHSIEFDISYIAFYFDKQFRELEKKYVEDME